MAEQILTIETVFTEKQLQIPYTETTTAEDICISACKQLGIGKVARHLFALRENVKNCFLMPSQTFELKNPTHTLRIRWKMANILRLRKIDIKAYDYYFHQARIDVLDNTILDLTFEKYRQELVGLGVADMYRVMVEENKTRETVESSYKKYIPKEALKKHRFFVKKPIHDTLGKMKNSGHDAWYVKEVYIKQLQNMTPEYPLEEFKALKFMNNLLSNVYVRISPFHATEPGIRYCEDSKRENWEVICTIEELGFVSIGKDCTVELSRKNGIPFYLKFFNAPTMHSFVSLLDGYYRMGVKWTFNICKNVPTPSLQRLHAMKCHGPVGGEFAYAKLEEKRGNRAGCFILRECESKYNIYYIDVCMKDSLKPKTFKFERLNENEFIFNDDLTRYNSLPQLMAAYNNPLCNIYLGECLPPSEYDMSPLLLCQESHSLGDALSEGNFENSLPRSPICINTKDLQVYKGSWCYTTDPEVTKDTCYVPDCDKSEECMIFLIGKGRGQKRERCGGMTFIYRSMWRHTKGKKMEVAMKILKNEHKDNCIKELLELSGQWAFLRSDLVVRLFGVTLNNPLSMVLEYMRLGPLDEYLRMNKKVIETVDLMEACSNLASALWHMSENGIIHGNIRCRKLFVNCHDNNTFTIKLADPGIHTNYSPEEVHWIPIECYANLNYARKSIAADVWAFATTVWEIFKYGEPLQQSEYSDAMRNYIGGKRLRRLENMPTDIYKLLLECWDGDPHRRKLPQAIMRDISQMFYQVYNSRKRHAYEQIKSVERQRFESICTDSTELSSISSNEELISIIDIAGENETWNKPWYQQEFDYDEDAFSCNFSSILHGFNISTATNSSDSINSIQSILELDDNCNVVLQGRIGQGFYGEVFKGTLEYISGDREAKLVAIKKLKATAKLSQMHDFEREIHIMRTLKHPNIVEIFGVRQEPDVSLIMEYVPHGSLQSYLKIHKESLTIKQLLQYSYNIAMGMDYLGKKNIVHRDLAARNILVVDENHVKISDFGLAQVVDKNNYYILKTDRELPIKWYALESLKFGKFSSKSDVWSYGVTMYEMFSYGEEPNLQISKEHAEGEEPEVFVKALESGIRLPCPIQCPQSVYVRIIHPCWLQDPHERPLFNKLCNEVTEMLEQD